MIKKFRHFLNRNIMKKSNVQKFNLGLFIILSTIILITALYFIGNRQDLFKKTFRISTVFKNANGLILGNNVRYSGINVGTVKNIVMVNDTTIWVDMIIEDKILKHLKKNAIATIGSDGLVGSMIINIVPSRGITEQLNVGDTIKSYSKISTNDMMTTLNTTNENAAILTADLVKITTAINEGEGTLGMLIRDAEMASSLKQTIINLRATSLSASKTFNELNTIISSINFDESLAAVLLSDSISAGKIKSIITNLEKSSNEISTAITNVNEVILDVKNGKGAINYMTNDTILVKNIDETVTNLKEGSIRLNENLEALKHNFLTRGYFRKQEKKKRKEEKSIN